MDKKSINEVAVEASLGIYGVGRARDSIIESYGYNPKRVQKIINRILKYGFPEESRVVGAGSTSTSTDKEDDSKDKNGKARTHIAITADKKVIKYSDIWDLILQTLEYFDSNKKLPDNMKYVVMQGSSARLDYNYLLSNKKKAEAMMNNDNNGSWDAGGGTSTGGDTGGGSGNSGGSDNSGGGSTSSPDDEVDDDPKPANRGTTNVVPNISFYIKNMLNERIIYLPVYPEELSESFSTNYSQTDLNGRSAPYQTYGGNEARTISLSATLHQDLCDETTGDLQTIVMYLKQLVYPKYNGSIVIPPYCFLKFGNMLNCYAIMDSIDFNWGETIIANSKYFSKCEVNFSFQELRKNSLPTVDNVFKNSKDTDS